MRRPALLFLFSLLFSSNVFAQNVNWVRDYQHAMEQSKDSGKPVFIDCFADWCGWCHRLEEEVFTDQAFLHYMEGFVPLRIDVEDQAEGSRLAEKFRIDSLPALLILDSDGQVLNRINSFMPAKELITEIESIQKLIQKEKLSINDWQNEKTLAEEYLFRDMNEQAETRFKKILEMSGVPDSQRESSFFSLALAQYYQAKLSQSLTTLNHYMETYVEGHSVEDVLLLRSQIYIEMEQPDKAKAILEDFLKKFPDSDNLQRVHEVLDHLQ